MGISCTRPVISETADVVREYLTYPVDYPRAATAFEELGYHEYAVLCWLAAGRPMIAERVYERGGLAIIDNRLGNTPIWRLIIMTRADEIIQVEDCKSQYVAVKNPPEWLTRIIAAI
jgi:hypothetical protein